MPRRDPSRVHDPRGRFRFAWGGSLSQNGALLDLEMAAIRYVRRLDELAAGTRADQVGPRGSDQN